jgi:hypothetical protein
MTLADRRVTTIRRAALPTSRLTALQHRENLMGIDANG